MNSELEHRVHELLSEAYPAANSITNGLFDRGDLQDMIDRLTVTVRQLTEACDKLERERDDLNDRLHRSPGPPSEWQ